MDDVAVAAAGDCAGADGYTASAPFAATGYAVLRRAVAIVG
jgi:hypothetical protein